ncbi:tRNA threonylcarbamoyladenosine biosynthesis protein RimN [Pasteurellaceae bacterium Pebbles2]|nr:tRNA threonylcarbamoyladenosine biosynthesis protein RimN [Pasteurellaceae bacterium Pebbles2]
MNTSSLIQTLKAGQVIAYPTEAVFGLGCDPLNQSAVQKLLVLKQRPVEKGLILIAPRLAFLLPFIDETQLSEADWQRLQTPTASPTTWVVPAKSSVPRFLTGQFNSIAVRICTHPAVVELCENAGFALTSTSANLTGLAPCKTAVEIRTQFGEDFPLFDAPVGGAENPSEIRDLLTNQLFRKG